MVGGWHDNSGNSSDSKMKEKLSVIVPIFNEEKTVEIVLEKLAKIDFGCGKEIIVVDDFSGDGSVDVVKKFIRENKNVMLYTQKKNFGKGAAIRKGLKMAKGSIVAFQDADLEYEVRDLKKLVGLVLDREDIVYGSRFLGKGRIGQLRFYFGNKSLSFFTSLLYFRRITDMETCYKVFRSRILKGVKLRANRFDIEPEITSKILRRGHKIMEVPIRYLPRNFEEGKKINWKDGVVALWTLIRYRFFD